MVLTDNQNKNIMQNTFNINVHIDILLEYIAFNVLNRQDEN